MNINKIEIMKAFILSILLFAFTTNCSKDEGGIENPQKPVEPEQPVVQNEVDFYLTKGDQSVKLEKQSNILAFGTQVNNYATIEVDASEKFQNIDGFGFTLTGGSAEMINSLNQSKRTELLQKLFGSSENSISINFLRLSIGASDLDASPFSYNDISEGEIDPDLDQFSIEEDKKNLIPLLKDILKINPEIKFMGTPWSPPVWMKDNKDTKGGSLVPEYYNVYARYLVKYIQAMKEEGINIYAITPQNEPLHPGNNPSMYMSALEQANFIKTSLGPAFENANIDTKIIIYDHNADRPQYPITILNDAEARKYVAGSAFHLYAGDISALSTVHNQFPEKEIYFTEQYTSSTGEFGGDLKWHLKNIIIGSMRNWSRTALEWNLANDANFGPHTDGGCTTCKGAVTVTSSSSYTLNVGFYIIGHASKFLPAGSERIKSNISGSLNNVAFRTPSGDKVLIVENDGSTAELFNVKYNGKWFTTSLEAGSVATFTWK